VWSSTQLVEGNDEFFECVIGEIAQSGTGWETEEAALRDDSVREGVARSFCPRANVACAKLAQVYGVLLVSFVEVRPCFCLFKSNRF
jgi:hypothetical protein